MSPGSMYRYTPLSKIIKRAIKRSHLVKSVSPLDAEKLPPVANLRPFVRQIYNQGELGSCTANAFCGAYNIMNTIGKKDETFEPSRLFFYYQERVIENSVNQDAGADVIDGESYVQTYGICAEKTWPYNPMFFTENPPISAYEEAPKHKISSYVVLPCGGPELIVEIKRAINNQQPVLIAVAIYESFEGEDVARTGKVPMPIMDRENCLGGHEMCLIGYDDALQCGMVLNSWGDAWGDKGICYIPYEYLMNPSLGQEFTVFQL